MRSLPFFNRCFTPSWKITVLALLVIVFFTRLGFWQLKRAEEKQQLLLSNAKFAAKNPISWAEPMPNPKQYQRISIVGKFLSKNFLLDNQHYQHQFGYQVLTPFELNSGNIILVDRGFIRGDIQRKKFPVFKLPNGNLTIKGAVYYPSTRNWVLGPPLEKKQHVTLLERIDTKLLQQILHKPVYPFIIRLDKNEAFGYIREWAIVSLVPENHYAYALQWFFMAFVTLILFLALNLKKKNDVSPD